MSGPSILILAGIGGACGATLRYGMLEVGARACRLPAWVTILLVNVAGGGLVALAHAASLATGMHAFVVVGVLGGFTTFSTAMIDVVLLYRQGRRATAVVVWLATPVVAVGAWFLATWVAGSGP